MQFVELRDPNRAAGAGPLDEEGDRLGMAVDLLLVDTSPPRGQDVTMHQPLIIAAGSRRDGRGSLTVVRAAEDAIVRRGCRLTQLHIAPLSLGWKSPLPPGTFRSGCAPLQALDTAVRLLADGSADAVVIKGRDLLRSEYAGDRGLRARRMAIYGEKYPLTEAYTDLARIFCARVGLSAVEFRDLAQRLFENHCRVFEESGETVEAKPAWFEPVTSLFRRVDCANPVVDFEGAVMITTAPVAEACAAPPRKRIPVLAVALTRVGADEPDDLEEIARYRHLAAAYRDACRQAGVDFGAHYLAGEALLETYTCYPVVPLAFLLASGIARDIDDLPDLLDRHPVTVTGGMNLARAAWNNPALHGLATLWERLVNGVASLAALHTNGGLGQQQGVAILGGPAANQL